MGGFFFDSPLTIHELQRRCSGDINRSSPRALSVFASKSAELFLPVVVLSKLNLKFRAANSYRFFEHSSVLTAGL